MTFDDTDMALATLIETVIKDANINGIAGYTSSVMTEAQYTPSQLPATMMRDINRDLAIAIVGALRQVSLRVPVVSKTNLPAPVAGGVVVVMDGAAGNTTLAFSDGVRWIRSDLNPIL